MTDIEEQELYLLEVAASCTSIADSVRDSNSIEPLRRSLPMLVHAIEVLKIAVDDSSIAVIVGPSDASHLAASAAQLSLALSDIVRGLETGDRLDELPQAVEEMETCFESLKYGLREYASKQKATG